MQRAPQRKLRSMRLQRPSIRFVLGLCLGAVGLAASVLAALLAGEIAASNSEVWAAKRVEQLAETIRERLEDGLNARRREIATAAEMLSALSPLLDPDASEAIRRTWLDRMAASYPLYAWLGLTDADGTVVVAKDSLLVGRSVASHDWYKAALDGPALGDVREAGLPAAPLPRAAAEGKLRVVDIAAPIRAPDGRPAGVLGAHLHWSWARTTGERILNDSPETRDDLLYILSRDGHVLLEPSGADASRPDGAAVAAALARGGWSIGAPDGTRFLMGRSDPQATGTGASLGWVVVVLEDAERVLAQAVRLERQILATGVVVGLALAVLGWLLGAMLAAPLVAIADSARRIRANGGTLRFAGGATAEIRSLADSLADLTGELQARQEGLLQLNATLERRVAERTEELEASHQRLGMREAQLRAVFDSVEDGIVTIDDRGRILDCNAGVERMYGMAAADLIGRNVSVLMPDPYRSAHDGYIARYLATGEARIIGNGREVEGLRRDGSVFPVEVSVSEMRVGDEHGFVGVMRDITLRKAAERAKNEFISTVSHELRTPLTSIVGSLGLLVGGAVGPLPDRAMNLLGIARKNGERLVRLINDILDIEKIDSGKLEFEFRAIDLAEVARQAVEQDRPFVEGLGVTLELVSTAEPLMVSADPARIGQVLANLISNAAKFSPSGAAVTVTVGRQAGAARISVADAGQGIPEEFRRRIFERFAQADGSDARKVAGTGLGLAISRGIVERHGGSIGFETETGKGTVFNVDLPLLQTGGGQPASLRPRILVCEDDGDIAELLRIVISRDGFEVDVAATVAEAERLLAQGRYAAMTLDIMLPDRSGLVLARAIRADARTAELPIVVVSARAREQHREDEAVMVDWLGKPVDMARLLRCLHDAVHGRWADLPEILHVEDDPDTGELVRLALEGFARVATVRTLAEACEMLDGARFDLVLLDIKLPDGSGLEVLDQIENRAGRALPVVIFTATDLDGATAGRVARVVTKSRRDVGDLVAVIRAVLEDAAPAREPETLDAL